MTDRPRPARRRRTPPPPPRGKREQPASRSWDRRLAQLAVSAVLLLAVVVVKITAPSAMDRYRDRLLDLMAGQTDFRAAFSAVGRAVSGQGAVGKALNDAYTAVFGPQDTGVTVPQDAADPAAYTAENTPGDVCLTQQVLGFAYANPLTGPVTDRFGYRQDPNGGGQQFHYGLDIAADEGAEMQVAGRMSYGGELLAAAAGPAVNLLLAAALGLPGRWWEPLYLLAGAQAVLGCFNLLPILPLDGGRMLWLALCWGTDPFLADRVAQAVSLAAAGLLTVAGAALARRSPFLLWTAAALLVCAAAPCIKRRRSVYASHKGR